MARQNQAGPPSERIEHRLILSQDIFLNGDDQITFTSLRIFLDSFSRDRKFIDRRAKAALDFPVQYFLTLSAGLCGSLDGQYERARSRFGQTHRPAFLAQQTGTRGKIVQHGRKLGAVGDVWFVKTRTNERLRDIESRCATKPRSTVFDALELDHGGDAFFDADSDSRIPGLDKFGNEFRHYLIGVLTLTIRCKCFPGTRCRQKRCECPSSLNRRRANSDRHPLSAPSPFVPSSDRPGLRACNLH